MLLLLHTREDLYFFISAFRHDFHSSLCTNTENTPDVSFKTPYSGEVVEWRTAVCILSEIDCFKWKKTLWKQCSNEKCTLLPTSPVLDVLPKRRTTVACSGTSLNTVFWYKSPEEYFGICCSVSHFIYSKCKKYGGNQTWVRSKIYGRTTSGLHFEMDPWHEQWSSERDLQLPQPTFTSWFFCILLYFFTELNCHPENHLWRCFLKSVSSFPLEISFEWNSLF